MWYMRIKPSRNPVHPLFLKNCEMVALEGHPKKPDLAATGAHPAVDTAGLHPIENHLFILFKIDLVINQNIKLTNGWITMNRIIIFSLIAALLFSTSASALEQKRTVFGEWKTIDDNTGEARSVVELYEKNGKLFGKIIKLFPRPGEDIDPVCEKCAGENKNKKIRGMVIINGLTKNGEEWDDGEISDPDSGEFYDCQLWLENGKLSVRGYVLFFFRTQTWLPFLEMN